MNKSIKWKLLLLVFVICYAGIALLPSLKVNVPSWWTKYLAPGSLNLGLDLQGGMHLVLKVDLDKAIENSLDFAANDLKESLREKKITIVRTSGATEGNKVVYTLPNAGSLAAVEELIKEEFSNLEAEVDATQGNFPRITLTLSAERVESIRKNAVDQALEIIRNRIDQFGVAEPIIVRQGADEIVIQLPGVNDPDRAMGLIGQTAQLEFKLVADDGGLDLNGMVAQVEQSGQWKYGQDIKVLNRLLADKLPAGTQLYFETRVDPQTMIETRMPLLVQGQIMMTGDMVADAQARIGGSFNEPVVSLDLTGRGSKIFAKVTSENVNKRFAIILDGVVKSAPVIREKILGGSAQISGDFTYEQASDLAIVLRVGALPAPVDIIQNLTVGASLGQDSINKGMLSGLLGTFLVVVFMLVYYRFSGFNANIALTLNILFLLAGLAALQATLTLPGIAGIILSIGMAVDSNVLIFERMREEFALGKTLKTGIEAGYDKALSTVVDAHVTTLITSLALFLFGTGPIKGFAVTLTLGISFNLFTTLFASRLFYDILFDKGMLKKPLKFIEFIKKPSLDYMRIKKFAFGFSAFFVLLGLLAFVQILRGQASMGVDFTGGSMLLYGAEKPFSLDEVRKVMTDNGLAAIELQKVTSENRLIVRTKKAEDKVSDLTDRISALLQEKLADKGFSLNSQTEIGSSVSSSLRAKALQAIGISLAGVLIYLAIRFNFHFGLAAAASTFHDILAVLGVCWLFDIEINLLIITALLTIGGYSLNDTVVVFDRIRENLQKGGNLRISEIINASVNEVMSRTLVASLTTLLPLISLFFLGGSVIHDFSFAMIFGIAFGTYSSIFVAGALLTLWEKQQI
ncbi:MAG: protein translocase subunit SecD [Thermodesulfobacteriota bacterium]